jgi:hypothetical protein
LDTKKIQPFQDKKQAFLSPIPQQSPKSKSLKSKPFFKKSKQVTIN